MHYLQSQIHRRSISKAKRESKKLKIILSIAGEVDLRNNRNTHNVSPLKRWRTTLSIHTNMCEIRIRAALYVCIFPLGESVHQKSSAKYHEYPVYSQGLWQLSGGIQREPMEWLYKVHLLPLKTLSHSLYVNLIKILVVKTFINWKCLVFSCPHQPW